MGRSSFHNRVLGLVGRATRNGEWTGAFDEAKSPGGGAGTLVWEPDRSIRGGRGAGPMAIGGQRILHTELGVRHAAAPGLDCPGIIPLGAHIAGEEGSFRPGGSWPQYRLFTLA